MIQFEYSFCIPNNFTGVCKVLNDNTVRYLKNGEYHREDGPAIECPNGYSVYYYNGLHYGNEDDDYTIESWIEFMREERLKVFI